MTDETEKKEGAKRVRNYRQRRKAAGLTELKVWVREDERMKALQAIHAYSARAEQALDAYKAAEKEKKNKLKDKLVQDFGDDR